MVEAHLTQHKKREERHLQLLEEKIDREIRKETPSLAQVTRCLTHIEKLPFRQRLAFLEKMVTSDVLTNPFHAKKGHTPDGVLGGRILQTIAVLWSEEALQAILLSPILEQGNEVGIARWKPRSWTIFTSALTTLLSWGKSEEAWHLCNHVFMPHLGIQDPWATEAKKGVQFLNYFCAHRTWDLLHQQMAGVFDLQHPVWRDKEANYSLSHWLACGNSAEQAAFRRLLVPHQCRGLHDMPLSERHAVVSNVMRLVHQRVSIKGLPSRKRAAQDFYETFPWMIEVAGPFVTHASLQERAGSEKGLTPPLLFEDTLFDEETDNTTIARLFGALCLRFLHATDWQAWGEKQPKGYQEALVWMAAARRDSNEAQTWITWAQQQGLPDDWWHTRHASPGLLTSLPHYEMNVAALSSHHMFTNNALHTRTGMSLLSLNAWAEALRKAYPDAHEHLRTEIGKALDTLLLVGINRSILGTPAEKGEGETLSRHEQALLFDLGKQAGPTWWEEPCALTREDIQHHEAWARRVGEGTCDEDEALDMRKEALNEMFPEQENTPQRRIERIAPSLSHLHALYEQTLLLRDLEHVSLKQGMRERRRV